MEENKSSSGFKPLLIIILIAAMTISLQVGIHETIHALTCIISGKQVTEFSALHVACEPANIQDTATKFIAGSAAIVNIIIGAILFFVLNNNFSGSGNLKWFLWLFMFANWSSGFGYLMFSGISGAGDYATVIMGWQPAGVWRVGMAIVGAVLWLASVWLSLTVLGKIFGGTDKAEMRKRFLSLSIPTYFSALAIALIVGLLNSYGILGLPSVAGLAASAGTLSPLFWMPYWFAADSFKKEVGEPLTLEYDMKWVVVAAVITLVYVLILGRGLTF